MLPKLQQNPKARLTVYQIGRIASSVIALLAIWKVVDGGTANLILNALEGVLGLMGVVVSGVAATAASRQIDDHTLDFSGPPAQQAVEAINAVAAEPSTPASDRERILAAAGQLAGSVPVVGPLAQQVINSVGKLR